MTRDICPKPPSSPARWVKTGVPWLVLSLLGWQGGYWAHRYFATADVTSRQQAAVAPAPPPVVEEASFQAQRARLLRLPGGYARRLALLELGERPPSGDPRTLLKDPALTSEEALALVKHWAERDPAACWQWHLTEGDSRIDFTNSIIHIWAKQDPEAAFAAALSAPWNKKGMASQALFGVWLRNENGQAATLAPHLDALADYAHSAASSWGRMDQEGVFSARILALPAGPVREKLLRGYGSGLFEQDWEKGIAWASQIPEADRQLIMTDFAETALAGRGPTIHYVGEPRKDTGPERQAWALKWMAEEASAEDRARLGPKYVEALGATDPAAALAWARESLGGLTLSRAVGGIVSAQADKDRTAAIALIEDLPPGSVRMQAAQMLAEKWSKQDPAAAASWALAQGEDAISRLGWGRLGSQWAFADAEGFKKFATENAGSLPSVMLGGALDNLARKDPPGTIAWAATLPEAQREQGVRTAFGEWVRSDSRAAATFIAENPSLPITDRGIGILARNYFSKDAEAALAWAENLPTGPRRDSAIGTLKESIQKEKNPARREAWLKRLGR